MLYRPKHFKSRTLSEFQLDGQNIPNFYRRIEKTMNTQLINMIVITGKSQTGKSTLARSICNRFDQNYTTVFTIEDLLNYLEKCKADEENVRGKWIFFDEPELEADRSNWYTERNKILLFILSSFGFLKNSIIMALPNIAGLSATVLTNLNLRIDVKAEYDDYKKTIVRRALIKKAVWSDYKNKFVWITTEIHKIPMIERDANYENMKRHNFFDIQLPKWREQLNKKNRLDVWRDDRDNPFKLYS